MRAGQSGRHYTCCCCFSGRGRGDVCGVQEAAEDAFGSTRSGFTGAAAGSRPPRLHQHDAVRNVLICLERWEKRSCHVSAVISPLRNWQTAPFMEVEVAIRLLYMLGEALPAAHGAHFSGDTAKTSALQDMMRTVSHMTARLWFGACAAKF